MDNKTKALFLDRDGVINVDKHHLYKIEDCEFINGIFDICSEAKSQGYLLIVVTNQAGIAKGIYTEDDYFKLKDYIHEEFKKQGCPIDAEYYCPYHTDAVIEKYKKDSFDRKPNPGMILKAQKDFNIDLSESILIGDKESDIEAGKNAKIGKLIQLVNDYFYEDPTNNADLLIYNLKSIKAIINPKLSKKIGYQCPFDNSPMAELETRKRVKYICEKLNHKFIPLNHENKTFDTKIHADNLGLDFILSHDTACYWEYPIPDEFSIFMHWSPLGFLVPSGLKPYFSNMYKYDDVMGGYESELIAKDTLNNDCTQSSFFNITSSLPSEFFIKPEKKETYKLFYVGINLEKIQKSSVRYGKLIKHLDNKDLIDIYGPNKLQNQKNIWKGYKNYNGSIPFDGKTILSKINKSGVCLALNSPVHNAYHTVSNRTYEAACAGSVIISDDNPYVRKYFGDCVFYVDITKSEEEQYNKILEYLNYINNHTETAYQMAVESQKCFLKNLTLNAQVENLIPFIDKRKDEIYNLSNQKEIIDIICFADNIDDWKSIKYEIDKQYWKKINVIVITDEQTYKKIDCEFNVDYVERQAYRGASFVKAIEKLKGDAFIFLDKYSAMHKNHIAKLAQAAFTRKDLFIYSGTYIKYLQDYQTKSYENLLCDELRQDDFLCFKHVFNDNIDLIFDFEAKFALSCVLFKKEILKYCEREELEQISNALHIYLANALLIKGKESGRFVSTISCGYKINEGENIYDTVFSHRSYYYNYQRCFKTFFKEMYEVFFKYKFEAEPLNIIKEGKWRFDYNTIIKLRKHPEFYRFIKKIYKDFPELYKTKVTIKYMRKHKYLRKVLKRLLRSSNI